ncbi:MAG: PAS domain-containing protein, partial [Cyanobacteria bacterium P01_E01_bin.43]
MSHSPHAHSNSLNFSARLLSAEEAESYRFFNALLISIIVHSADGRIAYRNQAAQQMFGPIDESQVALDDGAHLG